MTLSEMKQYKDELGLTYELISERSGVPFSTVQKIFSGFTKHPREATLQQLSLAFIRSSSYSPIVRSLGEASSVSFHGRIPDSHVAEPAPDFGGHIALEEAMEPGSMAPFTRQGTYTVEDYYRVPDERRVELINGVFYDMAAPSDIHQFLADEINFQFKLFIKANGGNCIPCTAPRDVRLDCFRDDRTMVQPDVMVICDRERNKRRFIEGAPDFIAEILSPSSQKMDRIRKLNKYMEAGVREYWIIDPIKGKVITYDLEDSGEMKTYSFGEKVPVAIYDGKLMIDFGDLPSYITDMYDENWKLIE